MNDTYQHRLNQVAIDHMNSALELAQQHRERMTNLSARFPQLVLFQALDRLLIVRDELRDGWHISQMTYEGEIGARAIRKLADEAREQIEENCVIRGTR